jgi:hypothetical protein
LLFIETLEIFFGLFLLFFLLHFESPLLNGFCIQLYFLLDINIYSNLFLIGLFLYELEQKTKVKGVIYERRKLINSIFWRFR